MVLILDTSTVYLVQVSTTQKDMIIQKNSEDTNKISYRLNYSQGAEAAPSNLFTWVVKPPQVKIHHEYWNQIEYNELITGAQKRLLVPTRVMPTIATPF